MLPVRWLVLSTPTDFIIDTRMLNTLKDNTFKLLSSSAVRPLTHFKHNEVANYTYNKEQYSAKDRWRTEPPGFSSPASTPQEFAGRRWTSLRGWTEKGPHMRMQQDTRENITTQSWPSALPGTRDLTALNCSWGISSFGVFKWVSLPFPFQSLHKC